jgi:hypothetical protein
MKLSKRVCRCLKWFLPLLSKDSITLLGQLYHTLPKAASSLLCLRIPVGWDNLELVLLESELQILQRLRISIQDWSNQPRLLAIQPKLQCKVCPHNCNCSNLWILLRPFKQSPPSRPLPECSLILRIHGLGSSKTSLKWSRHRDKRILITITFKAIYYPKTNNIPLY